MTIDIKKSEFRSLEIKLNRIAALAKQLMVKAAQKKAMGASQVLRVPRRKGASLTPNDTCCQVLLKRIARRSQGVRIMDKDRANPEASQERPRVVKKGTKKAQRGAHLQGRGDSLPSLRLQWFRIGSNARRLHGGEELLERRGQGTAHYLQGVEGRALRDQVLPPIAKRKKVAPTRGQPINGGRPSPPHVKIARHDVRAHKSLPPDG